jgi:preprotein translocase subunit SecG
MCRPMPRPLVTAALTVILLAVSASAAWAEEHDGGEGLWGETTDKVVTNFGFALIAFFPLFVLVMSLLQNRLDRRKDARMKAEKARKARADLRGGW